MTGDTAPTQAPSKLPYLGLFGLMLGIFLGTLDGQIVSIALPTIVGDLGGLDHFTWSVTSYLLTMAAATPIWGKLGDLKGRKGAYMWSVVLFLVGTVLCGLAQDMAQLIAFRAVQGLGAGGLMVGALSVIGVLVPAHERGRVQSMVGVMLPVAFVGGPLLGGFITEVLDWRWVFYVNVPFGVVALFAVAKGVRLPKERTGGRIDYPGTVLLTTAILALTLLAGWAGTRYGWGSAQTVLLAVVAAAALAGFVRVEQRAAEPVIPPRLFRSRDFALAQALSFLAGAVLVSVINYLPQYMQFVQGSTATVSGMQILPLMTGMLAAQLATGRLMDRGGLDRVVPITGGAVTVAGALLLLLLDTDTPVLAASALTLVLGIGVGMLMQSTLLTTMNTAPPRDMGAATGTVTLLRIIGGSLGVAALGAVHLGRMTGELTDRLGERTAEQLTSGGELAPSSVDGMPARLRGVFQEAFTSGLHGVLLGTALLSAAAFALAWFVRGTPAPKSPGSEGSSQPVQIPATSAD
ncbi:MFS transporter [Streptomyces sp. NBC_00243]|uniref:MDR family MFS transporter n=1 Tax=Streptomyces sp. NBC_00243 TaxID=2975688 RepID=UPI002DD953CB|nr:MDR family MFS transporter [Streptomyces sp. NBC_00243]WRZ19183.1 MFS transporter [Streptomyces sp. NBC_00243]